MIADFIEYNENFIYAKGNIKITVDNYSLTANSLFYDMDQDLLWAKGNVCIKDKNNIIIFGETVILKDKFKSGIISDFILSFGDNVLLVSQLAKRINKSKIDLYKSNFTPCQIICDQKPIWQISARNTEVDFDKSQMTYKHLFFEIYGVPVLYLPYLSHHTPGAEARSGILVPRIKDNALEIPLYLRAKPNMDFTFTPRIFQKYRILELEMRYKLNKHDYIFQVSYGKVPYNIKKDGKEIKNSKVNSSYFLVEGNGSKENYKYGFQLERTSDKAYLKNYYKNNNPYLISKLYFYNIRNYDYLLIEGLMFQGLRANDTKNTDSLILPKIRTKNVINLNDDETSYFVIENNSVIYKERAGKELYKISLRLSIIQNLLTSTGHLFHFTVSNRGDFYYINTLYPDNVKANKILIRNIPEFQTIWRYPLISSIADKASLIIEPIVSMIIGRKFKLSDNNFVSIDSNKYELSENNIFHTNRYNGIDYHEFGNRFSYGINTTIASNQNYFSLFLGQARNRYSNLRNKSIDNIENVGKIAASFSNQVELFYRFRKTKNFIPIRDEIGTNFQNDRLQLTASLIQLTNLKKYYSAAKINISTNKMQQAQYDINYQLTEHWSINYGMCIDLSKKKKQIFSKTIKVTYLKDCVKIVGGILDNYMEDGTRSIKKDSFSPTIFVGFKILNM